MAFFAAGTGPASAEPSDSGAPAAPPAAGSGNGNNGGTRPFDSFARAVPRMKSAAELVSHVSHAIECLDIEAKIRYLHDVGLFLESERPSNLAAPEFLCAIHHFMGTIDELTAHIRPGGDPWHISADIHNTSKPFFLIVIDIERLLLREGALNNEYSEMIADILSVFARKGIYDYALGEKLRKETTPAVSLWFTILQALDSARRYELLGLTKKARDVLNFLDAVRTYHELPDNLGDWALGEIFRNNQERIAVFFPANESPEMRGRMIEFFEFGFRNSAEGIYTYAPRILSDIAHCLEQQGMTDKAAEYLAHTAKAQSMAIALGLVEGGREEEAWSLVALQGNIAILVDAIWGFVRWVDRQFASLVEKEDAVEKLLEFYESVVIAHKTAIKNGHSRIGSIHLEH